MAVEVKGSQFKRVHPPKRPYYLSCRLSKAEYERYQCLLHQFLGAEVMSDRGVSNSTLFRMFIDELPYSGKPLHWFEYVARMVASAIR